MDRRLIDTVQRRVSRERGTVFKDPGGRISVCLVFPNTYHVGMSNLGFQGVYGLINRREDAVCERAFLPDEGDLDIYGRTGARLFSYESRRPLTEFDIVAFALSFEGDYPNIARILDLAGIPSRSSDRNRYHPVLMAGGVCCFFNPEPFSAFFDLIVVGEAEDVVHEVLNAVAAVGAGGRVQRREALKEEAVHIDGVYVPDFYEVAYTPEGLISERKALNGAPELVRVRRTAGLSSNSVTHTILTPDSEFSDMLLIEVMRGCPWNCRFCLVGHIYGRPRQKDLAAIRSEIGTCMGHAARVGLVGPSMSDYLHIREALKMEGVEFSITSLRAARKSAELIELMKGRKSVSIAPEAGTRRMREVINKQVTEQDILETAGLVFEAGIKTLRLYFMIGLPWETEEDIEGIVTLASSVRRLSRQGGIVLSVSTFVPKPFTPFQWSPMTGLAVVKSRLRTLKKGLKDVKGLKVFHDVPKHAHMQGLFSLGDRRLFKALELMTETDDYMAACSEAEIDPGRYVYRHKNLEEILPWDFIDTGSSKQSLSAAYETAIKRAFSGEAGRQL